VTTTLALTAGGALVDLARALREAFFMFWETLWPLVLGFVLSGAVQAFVSRERMQRSLGNHRPASVARATAYGMASSSCSFAASAMAKSLFQKGADFLAAMVFMFASTNLVVELGIVLAVLMGWQFTAAEFAGGPIMIVLLVALGGLALRGGLVEAARRRLAVDHAGHDDHADHEHHGPAGTHAPVSPAGEPGPTRARPAFTSLAGWSDAAAYTVADLTMLRRELVVGYGVAGFLAVLVPQSLWNVVFVHHHGGWTVLENAVVGPVIAFLSFVCSIGNVPMAAALWKGGIGFGGVVSFLFADLVAAPLVLVYRRYYGGALTVRLVALFWVVMSAAGLIVGEIFSAGGLVPAHRPLQVAPTSMHWNATTVLDIVALLVFAACYWLYRNRARFGGGGGHAIDPVCGMQVETSTAPATAMRGQLQYWFCSDRCAARFAADGLRPTSAGRASSP
jgi:uncharacterized membrane protein YraQ (UPF0718 family)/YHS domain-containing protein